MGLLSRFMSMIRAKMSSLLEGAEDPAEALDYSYQQQLKLLQDVKKGLVEVVTSRRRLELQAAKLRDNVEKLDDQAREALRQDREDLARLALQRKNAATTQLTDLEQQIDALESEQKKLQEAETRLSLKVESFRTRKETIKAQYNAAEAQVRIGEAATGLSEEMADIGLAIERAEGKTEEMRARSAAIDELVSSGLLEDFTGSGDAVERELKQLTTSQSIDAELAQLKRELGAPKETAQLPAGDDDDAEEDEEA